MRIAPPFLPSDHSSPATSPLSQLKHSSAGIIWMYRASFTSISCSLPWSSTVVAERVWENHHPIHWEDTTVLDHGRVQELLKEVLHIQMIHTEECLNQDGGLEVPGCCTVMRRQGRAILPDLWPPMTCILTRALAISGNICSHFFHFCPDENWSTQSASYFPNSSW